MSEYPGLPHEGQDPSPHMSGQLPPTTVPRGQKRSLTAAFSSGSGTLRTAVACRSCRERKTRCSGHQPRCNYCSRAGVPCEYLPGVVSAPSGPPPTTSDVSLDEWGGRILGAVEGLRQAVTAGPAAFQHQRSGADTTFNLSTVLSAEAQLEKPNDEERHGPMALPGPSPITSLPSILQWDLFEAARSLFMEKLVKAAEPRKRDPTIGLETASCNTAELLALAARFVTYQDGSLQIVEMATLRSLIADIGEFGVPWSAESCLVLLVAALGSLLDTVNETAEPRQITREALRYWNMARKRLAWAAGEGGLLGAQCHFLAGIWQLYDSDPKASWKSMATALQIIDDSTAEDAELELCQNIRALSLALLCRLCGEVSLSFVQSSYHLASRPCLEGSSSQRRLSTAMLSLLEIRQKVLASFECLSKEMSLVEISTLLANRKDTEQQLNFIRDEGEKTWTDLGLARFMLWLLHTEIRELCLRPFLYVAMHASTLRPMNTDKGTMEAVVRQHIRREVWENCLLHRLHLKHRLQQCFDPSTSFLEVGWLRIHDCATLGLLCLASKDSQRWGDFMDLQLSEEVSPTWFDSFGIRAFLDNDHLCRQASSAYSDMLQWIHAQ
ncbi:hypothetical protein B0T11DRAFT_280685 [Plectosphaerella cucumerina]|uniref:Zn(2)-C6 fungal-type domain-containing protein n=1 Tax=Plectosphaerella cucumerina TaxID=40658 RepID=A0A8K0TL45_9PEZI|nr:hypothetical protein B0T11DRAFT_280685 [Plectosphaerella cucumerina]